MVVRAEHLSKQFGPNRALDALSLEVREGEVLGLLGPNGAGKTTTLKLLLGMLRPSSGRCEVLGLDCTHAPMQVRQRLGFTPDEPSFYDFLTGRETIEFVARVHGVPSVDAWTRLTPQIERLGFTGSLDVLTSGYSHGTKKKLALLLALVHAPRVLLLDEPTNGLDPPSAAKVRELLIELARSGVTVIISTHLLDMVDRLCGRVVILHKGRLLADGSTDDIRRAGGVEPGGSLEEAFLRLTREP